MGLLHVAKVVPLILGPHDLCDNYQIGMQVREPISKEAIYPQVNEFTTICGFHHHILSNGCSK
jgi:hypothetical protein